MKITIAELRNLIKEEIEKSLSEEEEGLPGACWSGYEAIGFKEKNGKRVPNCVPKKKKKKS
jgi:hypothetical protein